MRDESRDSFGFLYGRLDYERVGMPASAADMRIGRMRRLLGALGDPQDGLRIVHVAGTKGKGSTSYLISEAARGAGYRAGLLTSPHLHRLGERFRVDGLDATDDELDALIEDVRPAVERLDHTPHFRELGGATFFEITTAMGLLHFAKLRADPVVLEVGMGGRLDSTSAIRPLLSVLTTISFDHTRLLGSTLGAIASEKAGIIKRGRPVVSGVRGEEARAIIRGVASARRAPLREIDVDFRYTHEPPRPPLVVPTPGRTRVSTWRTDWGDVGLSLLGEHQALNASVALAAVDVLDEEGLTIGRHALNRFGRLDWPARAEVIGERPWLVVDGAHNPASAVALASALRTCFPSGPRTLVFAASREKDFRAQLEALLPGFARVICTRYVENPRSVAPGDVAAVVLALGHPPALVADDPASALELARSITPEDGLICATGSLFLAAEFRAAALGLVAGSSGARP